MILRNYQQESVNAIYQSLRERDDNPCAVLPTGCHAKGHPILKWNGTVAPVEKIVQGDLLIAPDVKPRKVVKLCRGFGQMFKIIPDNEKPFIVNSDHILSLVFIGKKTKIKNISVKDYFKKTKKWKRQAKLYKLNSDFKNNFDIKFEYIDFKIKPSGFDDYYGFTLDKDHLYVDGNLIVHHNSGKTPVLATICKEAILKWNGRVLVLAHVKELLEQACEKLNQICPELNVGVYSAGLKKRDTTHPVIVAGIQSVYKRACELDAFDLIIIDEAHLIPTEGDGMYRKFLQDAKTINPIVRLIGLTATPFRMKRGMICAPENILNNVCYEIGIKELIRDGYLCPLVTKASYTEIDTSKLHVRAGEFISSETEELMDTEALVESACKEILEYTINRHSCLIFASGVYHANHLALVLKSLTEEKVATIFGDTPSQNRSEILNEFKDGKLKYLINVNVLTTGFDAPNIDCVAMVRPTMSPGLFYQMAGRGFRIHESKKDCLILDFGGNVLRHGPVDAINIKTSNEKENGEAPVKKCPDCNSLVATGYSVCPDCGYIFPPPKRQQHEPIASNANILSGKSKTETYDVEEVYYHVHHKKGAPEDAPKTMRVEYRIGWRRYQSEWICFEHSGWARLRAESWWKLRSNAPLPNSSLEAVELAAKGALCKTKSIIIRSVEGEEYDRIIGYELEDISAWNESLFDDEDDEIPF